MSGPGTTTITAATPANATTSSISRSYFPRPGAFVDYVAAPPIALPGGVPPTLVVAGMRYEGVRSRMGLALLQGPRTEETPCPP
jgi:hypothetical protein